jgi:hypothetical protein
MNTFASDQEFLRQSKMAREQGPYKDDLKTIEIELPQGGGGGPSCDNAYDEAVDRAIRNAIPLGGRYVDHTTRTIHKVVATVHYVPPAPKNSRG